MELRLNPSDRIRITTGSQRLSKFIDAASEKAEIALSVSFLCSQTYFEVRKKDGQIKCFFFEKKGHKKYFDFGWWNDAEVVFANNDVRQD